MAQVKVQEEKPLVRQAQRPGSPAPNQTNFNQEQPKPEGKRFSRMHFLRGNVRVAGHYMHVAYLWLALLELIVGYSAFVFFDTLGATEGFISSSSSAAFFGVLCVMSFAAMGLYDTRQRNRFTGVVFRIVVALCLSVGFFAIVAKLLQSVTFSGVTIVWSGAALIILYSGLRAVFEQYVDGYVLKRKILVLGTGKRARLIDQLRRKSDIRGFHLVGFVPSNGCQHCYVNSKKLLKINGVCNYALENSIDEIIIALDDRRHGLPIEELLDCRMSGIEVTEDLDFFEREAALVQLDLIKSSWLIHAKGFTNNFYRYVEKRIFDVVGSVFLGVLLAPLMLITALAIRIECGKKAPIIYTQTRVGRDGRPFTIYKFRSMCSNAEEEGKPQWASCNDSRITRVGEVIRKYRIDETPQLWNVFIGDMSLVGPRPERPEFVESLNQLNEFYGERHRVAPGLTGWAQLSYPYGASDKDSIEKLKYDLYYVKNHGFFLDLYILIQTAEIVLFKKGSR